MGAWGGTKNRPRIVPLAGVNLTASVLPAFVPAGNGKPFADGPACLLRPRFIPGSFFVFVQGRIMAVFGEGRKIQWKRVN
ncbi:hypothetical protein A6M21_00940 [Desulfotomaculum copahuensis]|uniref:Uncharacterized protein n=1 Tax=Desulfotomaculum copahuensis TaxID=1838280 RepID=A0A1B7LBU5_9FIRM|nr:hypothetical protein A6M21_00940 [Desulfotomaculum copahuensis]